MFVVSAIVSSFGVTNRTALIANRFYTWDLPDSFKDIGRGGGCCKKRYVSKIDYSTAS
jgi:hypothetical protein